MHSLHENYDATPQLIDVTMDEGVTKNTVRVRATGDIVKGGVLLAPCNPKASRVVTKTENHTAVEVKVTVMQKDGPGATAVRTQTVWVLPEFKIPARAEKAAVADNDAAVADTTNADQWNWGDGDVSMHPFWAVRRMTPAQLVSEQNNKKVGERRPRFNCEFVKQLSLIHI